MKFSVVFVAAAALLCSHLVAGEETTEIGEVKGMPLVFNGPATFRQEHLVKGQALTHSRTDSTSYAVPDPWYLSRARKSKRSSLNEGRIPTLPCQGARHEQAFAASSTSICCIYCSPIVLKVLGTAVAALRSLVLQPHNHAKHEEKANGDAHDSWRNQTVGSGSDVWRAALLTLEALAHLAVALTCVDRRPQCHVLQLSAVIATRIKACSVPQLHLGLFLGVAWDDDVGGGLREQGTNTLVVWLSLCCL